MKIIYGDILDITDGIICQQVNCMGIMGSGLAKQIKYKYPRVYYEYSNFLKNKKNKIVPMGENIRGLRVVEEKNKDYLGRVQFVAVDKNLYVVNMFAQYEYGRLNQVYTEYNHFERCLMNMVVTIGCDEKLKDLPIYFPYKIGCGLGGGDWNIIFKLIEKVFPNAIIVKKEN